MNHPSSPDNAVLCLPPGYQPRLAPEYYEDSVTHATGIVWQPDVYPIVADVARRFGCCHVLDLGCGRGDKLAALHPEFMITGVDFGANIQRCRQTYAFGQWLEADFETAAGLPLSPAVLTRTVVVCSDVIEHLIDPVPLLRLLGRLLQQVPVVLLSTPDRDRARGPGDMGPPKNKAHTREWTLPELEALLRRQELPLEFIGFTRSNTQTGAFNTQIAILSRPGNAEPILPTAKRGDAIGIVNGQTAVVPDTAIAAAAPTVLPTAINTVAAESAPSMPVGREISPAVLDAAEASARAALKLNPNGLEALRLLVKVGVQRRHWPETGRSCLQILQQTPGDIEILLTLAKCFFQGGDRETTRVVLERILEIDPACALARENLAVLTGSAGDVCSHATTAAAGTAAAKGQADPGALAACIHRAQLAIEQGNLNAAQAELKHAVTLSPGDADLCVALGNVQARSGDLHAARSSYARALAIDPRHEIAGERIVELTVGGSDEATGTTSTANLSAAPQPAPKTAAAVVTPPPAPVRQEKGAAAAKENAELAYWKARKDQEGTLANGHYEAFYTAHFGLSREYYDGKRILDIGCGPRGSLEWADGARERVGLDPLAERYRELGADAHRMRYVASGSENIPFPDEYFDVVASFNSLDHVADLDRTISEILRVVKPGGFFLLLTDVNHSPTPCEPIEFGWSIVERFKTRFDVVEERHFEKLPKTGLYRSVEEGVPYDHQNPQRRYGILSVKFRRRPAPHRNGAPVLSTGAAPPALQAATLSRSDRPSEMSVCVASGSSTGEEPPARNARAFVHLQRSFELLKERQFAEARAECATYRHLVQYDALPRDDQRELDGPPPEVSVVIVAYRIGRGLIECLDSLGADAAAGGLNGRPATVPHEIIVVDNGGNEDIAAELARRRLLHIRMPMNVILSEGRNVGVHFARAPIVAFVDDDAITAPGYLAGVIEAFRQFDIDGYRGKVLPKTDSANNRLARHYDMGDLAFPADVDTEGNSAFATAAYREMGGMDPLLFGMEGTELSYRIAGQRGAYRTIYWPGAVIHHDYAGTDDKLGQKNSRHQLMREYATHRHPRLLKHHQDLIAFNQSDAARRTGHGLIRLRTAPGANQAMAGEAAPAMTLPFFSICIPTYNRARYIRETIASALAQTYPKFEVVIVDDGSTDDTAEIVASFSSAKIRYLRKEHSGGPATRNRCIAEAHGEFLVWVDSDDCILPRTLEVYAGALQGSPAVDVIYGDLRVINEQSTGDMIWAYQNYQGWSDALLTDLVFENRIPNVCTMVRREAYRRVGGYAEDFPRAHDYEFWTRLAVNGSVHRVNEIVGLYRQHSESLSQHSGKTNTSYEALAVQRMIECHGLPRLLPHCFAPHIPESRSMAHAWLIAAGVMLKYGQTDIAGRYLERSLQSALLPAAARLQHLIQAIQPSSETRARSGRSAPPGLPPNSFAATVEQALRAYRQGQAGECAKACAQLTEIAPEELETLFLTGASLFRWGKERVARAGFGLLINRLSEAAYADVSDANTSPSSLELSGTTATSPLATLAQAIARVLDISILPPQALQRSLDFLGQLAVASDPRRYLALHQAGLTPVTNVLLGWREGELREHGGDETLVARVRQARNALVVSRSAARVSRFGGRQSGWSFCIITNGRRPEKLRRQIESIRALGFPQCEILVGGDVPAGFNDVTVVPMKGAAARGRLAQMRNTLARQARFDRLVVSDDDLVFHPDFRAGLERFEDSFEMMAVRLVNPDGSRFWDWATAGGNRGQSLLEYWDIDPDTYVTGGLCVLRAEVLDQVKWDENRGFYELEDVDFSRRARAAGISIRFNPFCRVTHDDDRYTRVGRKVIRFEHLLTAASQRVALGDRDGARLYLEAARGTTGGDRARESALRDAVRTLGEEAWWKTLAPIPARNPAAKATSPLGAPIPSTPLSQSLSETLSTSAGFDKNSDEVSDKETKKSKRTQCGSATTAVRISWDGSFLDLGSLSHVNRELTAALARRTDIDVTCLGQPLAAASASDMAEIRAVSARLQSPAAAPAQITVRHAWPPDWRRPRDGAWVLIQPWEFGALPKDWVRELARVDEIWVPSEYVRRVYVDSGIAPEKVHVVPNGIDPQRFHPAARPLTLPTRKKFKFLFVGGTIHRKGPDLLLKAYLDRFNAEDDVCLVIKDFGGQSVYAGQTFEQAIAAARARPNAPEILHLTKDLTADQMAGLYTACDCLVHPYRGEGFGLPVLEAMACGRPVVVTAGGATDDFVPEECGWHLPAARRQFGDAVSGMKLVRPGWFLEPDAASLAERLGWVAAHPDEAQAKGLAAAAHARDCWTWDHTAAVVAQRAQALVERRQATNHGAQAIPARPTAPRPDIVKTPEGSSISNRNAGSAKSTKVELQLPTCARIGHLVDAKAMLGRKQYIEAWDLTVAALRRRPFHPEAWLTLAEIAHGAGHSAMAKTFADAARRMAPGWPPARRFDKTKEKGKGGAKNKTAAAPTPGSGKVTLPALPEDLQSSPRAPRLSVCVIARNEEQFLDRCLESVRGLASQIVLLDTGSTDATCDIARRHGAEVHQFAWNDDFSAARNATLEHVNGDWVLSLDADEELLAADRDKLRQLLERPAVIAYRLPIIDQGREAEGVNYVPRLYRNAPGLFYVGRVHEQVFSSIEVRRAEWGLQNELGDATLLHHGYTREMVASRDKIARNLRLLELAIDELPGEPNLLMNLGLELVRAERLHEGLERYQQAFEAMTALPKSQVSPELREALLTQYGTHLLTAKHYAEIARLYQSALASAHGLTATMHWLLGLACIESKLYSEGAEQMRHCLAKRGKRGLTLANQNILKAGPHHCLALCLAAMKRWDEAGRAFQEALRAEPDSRGIRFDYARFLVAHGQEVEALKWLHQLMAEDPADTRVWRLGGAAALQKPDYLEFALDWTGEAVKAHPQHAGILEQRATALMLGGQLTEAQACWQKLGPAASPSVAAAKAICEIALGQNPAAIPEPVRGTFDTELLRWYRRLLGWNVAAVVNVLNQRLTALRAIAPAAAERIEAALTEAAETT